MTIGLQRTFSPLRSQADNGNDWLYDLRGSDKFTWKDLHKNRVTVVVGEAGIGKTIELKSEATRLQADGKVAFFVELNQLCDQGSWELALEPSSFPDWLASSVEGYFFLDAVDEARLTDHAALKKALRIVRATLCQHLTRVRITISSRLTDWAIKEVRTAVEELLVFPIEAAFQAERTLANAESADKLPTVKVQEPSSNTRLEPFVVSLNPLSKTEALKLAVALDVNAPSAFWAAIEDGQFEYMATRPLDLGWMVGLWNRKGSLGSYIELLEENIANRLTETNPGYHASNAVLPQDQLRRGAEELAAESEFSGRAFVATVSAVVAHPGDVAPLKILTDWSVPDVSRLLGSAIFDEATFDRVKFHHRSAREYLAACWANRQLSIGTPLHRVLELFAASPFDEIVLIPRGRWALCWLSAMNVKVREWVTRHFPEMLLFDGDPEAWDVLSAEQAFMAYVQRLQDGLLTDWYNDASEFRRVGRRLPSGCIAGLLANPELPAHVKTSLFPMVKHAGLTDCANAVFALYKDTRVSTREHLYAIDVLNKIATPEQRKTIKADLLSCSLASNDLIASALGAADWQSFTVKELTKIFATAESEDTRGTGPMARALKEKFIPATTAMSANLLLDTVVALLPRPEVGKGEFDDSDPPEHSWLLNVLPECLERLLTLLPVTLEEYSAICFEAAVRVESLRDSGFVEDDLLNRLHSLIAKHHKFRWQLGLKIALSDEITYSPGRLTWGTMCIISFDLEDMPELITRANDTITDLEESAIWFAVAKSLAFRRLRGRARKAALTTLEAGPESETRTAEILAQRGSIIEGVQQSRVWKAKERLRKRNRKDQQERNKIAICAEAECIRAATCRGTLNWLLSYSGRDNLTCVDFGVVAMTFGQEVADAFAAGLKEVWTTAVTPNPSDYLDGSVPWEALTALAGLHTLFSEGLNLAALNKEEVYKAAQLAVWVLNGPPTWFEQLSKTHTMEVSQALHPWIINGALSAQESHQVRRALEMAFRCSVEVRPLLLRPLAEIVMEGRVTHPNTLWDVFRALHEDGLIVSTAVAEFCRKKLVESINKDGVIGEIHWLHLWLEKDISGAWSWFEEHVSAHDTSAGTQVNDLAKAMGDLNWLKPKDDKAEGVLLQLYGLLLKHRADADSSAKDERDIHFGTPVARLLEAIPRKLVQIPGRTAHRALAQLAATEVDDRVKNWLRARIYEHSALEATKLTKVELRTISSPFLTEPRSEGQLFQQVVARLEEIRKGVEEGPFSDRDLFFKGIPERMLQVWLAARFHDTQNRRFSIHREEEVDANNRTDIQLSCGNGNVCVEIKPTDAKRSYTAKSLADTLRTQIVGQYLKGYNSNYGILVLFRLDNKTWSIPGEKNGQPFSSLVTYLRKQADLVKLQNTNVQELMIFPIDCLASIRGASNVTT